MSWDLPKVLATLFHFPAALEVSTYQTVGFGTLRGRLQCLQFCLYLFGGFNEIWSSLKSWKLLKEEFGGARRDRTADLDTASVALSQLSYSPTSATDIAEGRRY